MLISSFFLFPFFALKLLFLNGVFLLRFFFFKHPQLRLILLLIFFILFLGILSLSFFLENISLSQLKTLLQNESPQETSVIHSLPETTTPFSLNFQNIPTFSLNNTPKNIENKILFYEELLKKQPTQKDVLLNLAILENSRGNKDLALKYLEKARGLDPNNAIFSVKNP